MATATTAVAVGMGMAGSWTPGRHADLVIVSGRQPHLHPAGGRLRTPDTGTSLLPKELLDFISKPFQMGSSAEVQHNGRRPLWRPWLLQADVAVDRAKTVMVRLDGQLALKAGEGLHIVESPPRIRKLAEELRKRCPELVHSRRG